MNSTSSNAMLGILGGLGPMSGVYFCEMLISHTAAQRDSDHINFLLSSRADTPDRSSFILGESKNDPTEIMTEEALRLERAGAQVIAIPCNTAHYFYKKICERVSVPIINIIEETASFCAHEGLQRVGVLATRGTIDSRAYADVFEPRGIEILPLTPDEQEIITNVIFNEIKKGIAPDLERFMSVCDALRSRGAQRIILGCTELSLIKKENTLGDHFIDSLELLALAAITRCQKTPVGFDKPLMNFYAQKGNPVCC